jgi:hypothetical protein
MTRYACSGCGKHTCYGRCFSECPADYPEDQLTHVYRPPPLTEEDREAFRKWCDEVDAKKRRWAA